MAVARWYGRCHAGSTPVSVNNLVTLITSQIPVKAWHEVIGEPTLADAILDRIVHLEGQSYRAKEAAERATQRRKKPKIKPNP